MAEIGVNENKRSYRGVGLWLDRLCKSMAALAGLVLVVMALLSLYSIVGRSLFGQALVGDYELVQMLTAVAVALSLPYAHWIGGHVIVDFFTTRLPRRANAALDLVANVLLALMAGVLSWRLAVGMLDLRSNFDASMLLSIPTWWSYAPLVPAFALLSATALYTACGEWAKLGGLHPPGAPGPVRR